MILIYNLEDFKIMRDGIRFLLSQEQDFEFVGGGNNPNDLYEALSRNHIDILLLDIYLNESNSNVKIDGYEVCEYVARKYPQTRVIAHSMYDDADKVIKMMNAGARGFISKRTGFDELAEGIRIVYHGGRYICLESGKNFKNLGEFISGKTTELKTRNDIFTKREKEVLELMAKGYASKAIANKLFITEKTVESHRKNMVTKAQVKNTMELITFATGRCIIKL